MAKPQNNKMKGRQIGSLSFYIDRFPKPPQSATSNVVSNLPQKSWFDGLFVGEEFRALPKLFCSSALFNVKNKKAPRLNYINHKIFSFRNFEISYTGIELRAYDDQLVWLELIHLSNFSNFGCWIEFKPHTICKSIGWHATGQSYERIRNSLLRLQATAIKVQFQPDQSNSSGVSFSLLDDFYWSNSTYKMRVGLGLKFLFYKNDFARIEWAKYVKLTPIARRIFDYTASNRHPFKLRLVTVQKLLGSDTSSAVKFRQQVRFALSELISKGLISEGEVQKVGQEFLLSVKRL